MRTFLNFFNQYLCQFFISNFPINFNQSKFQHFEIFYIAKRSVVSEFFDWHIKINANHNILQKNLIKRSFFAKKRILLQNTSRSYSQNRIPCEKETRKMALMMPKRIMSPAIIE
jgi:pantothenate kinase